VSALSNPSDLSDLEPEAGSSALQRIELSVASNENSDTENNQGDNELDSQSSLLSSDCSGIESDEEETVQATRYNKRQRQRQCRGQRSSMPSLRDRLRSLRHRRTLNITEQSDYKDVLDCLKVVDSRETVDSDMAAPSRFFNSQKTVSMTASANIVPNSPEACSNESSGPGTSKSFTQKWLKSLNEQKRKIELNKDTDAVDTAASLGTESQAGSNIAEKVVFKKFRRKANKESKKDDSSE
jgi:hypothetical protein